MAGDHAGKDQRQEARAGRDAYVAGRDLTINIYPPPDRPDLIGAPAMGVEIMVRRRFVMDWESKRPRLADS
jgi:hypothetical protein